MNENWSVDILYAVGRQNARVWHCWMLLVAGGLFLWLGSCSLARPADETTAPEGGPVVSQEVVAPEPQLGRKHWRLISLNGQPPLPETELRLSFWGNFYAYDGCNSLEGSYTAADGILTWGNEFTRTALACGLLNEDGNLMRVESWEDQKNAYIHALFRSTNYRFDGDMLELRNAAGEVTLTFITWIPEVQPPIRESSAWILTSFVEDGAITLPLAGTEITLVLEGGSYSHRRMMVGKAGCNNYQVQYEGTSDELKVVRLLATHLDCREPEGVMEQEAYFLSLLTEVHRIRFHGPQLSLYTPDGKELSFGREVD
jgi:heat shock protein HslJ